MRLCMYFILSTLLTLSCSKVDQESSQLHLRPLTVEDKLVDFDVAVNQFKNYYAPYQYKEQRFGVSFEETFAALRQEVIDSQSDQEFYDILGKLVATFNDGHVSIAIPNMGTYALPFVVDHFNGNYVVSSVEDVFSQETGLMVGDRLVSMDGRDAESIVNDLMRYQSLGYERSSRRLAAFRLTNRTHQPPQRSRVNLTFERGLDGQQFFITSYWFVPELSQAESMETTFQNYYSYSTGIERFGASIPFYYNPKVQDQYNFKAASITKEEWEDAGNTGFPFSPFAMIYNHQGKKILLMRIPTYNVTSKEATRNVKTYEMLLKKYQDQVDVLVLDQTHNPGGSVAYVQDLAELFLKSPGPGMAFAPRADREWLRRWNSFLSEPDLSIFEKNFIQQIYREIDEANDAGDFLAPPIPLTSISGTIPGKYVWQKPVLLLIDELCGSGGDAFPMIMKGNQAATLWGHRTSGLGGNVDAISPLPITKADLKLTRSLFFLANANGTIPDGPLIENNGVEPDVKRDYGYQDLMEGYTSYIQDFSDYAVGLASPAS